MSAMPPSPPSAFNSEDVKVWERIIDVQKHFNEVKSKNRTLFISIVTASLAATGYLFQNQSKNAVTPILFQLPKISFPINYYTLLLYSSTFRGGAFHSRLLHSGLWGLSHPLKAAVECGKDFERNRLQMPLTSVKIEEFSEKHALFGFIRGAGTKLHWFYGLIGFGLQILFVVLNIKIG